MSCDMFTTYLVKRLLPVHIVIKGKYDNSMYEPWKINKKIEWSGYRINLLCGMRCKIKKELISSFL